MLRKVFYMTCLLTLSAIGFGGMGMMGMNQCSASESWDCTCGKKGLNSNFCVECGLPRHGKAQNVSATTAEQKQAPRPELIMVDGPGMANVNAWKHGVLNGGWMTPKGDLHMDISGFDYKFGVYKQGEPDNFRWHKDRFYFAGWQNSPNRDERFDLCFSEEPCIKDAEGNVMITLLEMWHEKRSIYMKVKYPNSEEVVVRELRQAKDIAE